MRPHRVLVLDVLTRHPPQMPFVDGDDVIEALAPERADHALGDGVGVRCAHRSQNRLDPDPSSTCDEVPAIATVAVSDQERWLLTPGGRLDHLPPDPGRDRVLRDVPVPDAAPAVVDHDEHGARAAGEGLDRAPVSGPDAGRVVAQKRAPRLTRRSRERLLTVAAHGAGAHVEAKRTQLTNDADGAAPWMLSGAAQDQPLPLGGNVGTPRSATTLPAPVGAPRERCQRTTVSGSTITSVPRQPDQPRASSDQHRRSWRRSRGRRRPRV